MESILYTVIALGLAGIAVELLCSDGETGKYVRAIYGVISVLIVLGVIMSVALATFKKVQFFSDEGYISAEDSESLSRANEDILSKIVIARLKSNNCEVVRIQIMYSEGQIDEIEQVIVTVDDKDADTEIMNEIIANTLSIERGKIVYEYKQYDDTGVEKQ